MVPPQEPEKGGQRDVIEEGNQPDNELRIGSQTLDQRANKSYAEL